jgi:hypothetical protein
LPAPQIVLVAAVGVSGRVGVVLEQVDVAGDAFFVQSLLGVGDETLEDALAGLVVGHQAVEGVAFGRRVLGVAADIEVEAGAVLQEHVGGTTPRNDAPEEVTSHLIG